DDMTEADINRFAKQINIQYAVLLSDPQKSWQLPVPEVLPTSYLLDPQGKLQATLVGPQTKAGVLKEIASRG
ncbi:MAG: TlpA family protein disulfide reductase, partial [Gammaproteobacteria bacterium]|nr:TlpA family protein disulfide reductase [Gammaproteobacteria bacterium]